MRQRRGPRISAARLQDRLDERIVRLFGLDQPDAIARAEAFGRQQAAAYAAAGLRCVPGDEWPAAVGRVLESMALAAGQRLLEIGPGPHGGVGLVAALMGLDVVILETDVPFTVDVDRLRAQLASTPGPEALALLDQVGNVGATVQVQPIANLMRTLDPDLSFVAAAGGSIRIEPGSLADSAAVDRLAALGPFDHIICTDVIDPTSGELATTTAATTTSGQDAVNAMVAGLVRLAPRHSLYVSLLVPEENREHGGRIASIYAALEDGLAAQGRSVRVDRVVAPASSSVIRARLYHLGSAPA